MSKDTMSFCDGEYTVTSDNGALYAHRHGEPWNRDLTGDNLVYWMLVDALALKQERDELAESERSCREDNQKFLAEIDALKAEVGALKVERDELSNTVFSAVNSLAESRIILTMLLEKLKSPLRSKLFSDCKTAIEQSSKEV